MVGEKIFGVFSSGELDDNFPTCELFSFEKYDPKLNKKYQPHDNYLSILNIDNDFDAWHCDELENLFIIPKEDRDNSDKYNFALFCNINKVLANQDLSGYGDNKENQLTNFLSYMDRTFGIWVLSVIAKTYDRSLGKLRDSFGQVGDLNSTESFKNLIKLERRFLDIQRNTIPFVYEIKEYCKYKKHFLYDVYEFNAIHVMRKNTPPLFESVRGNLLSLSNHLKSNTNSLETSAKTCRQIATVNSSDELAKANIKLQKIMSLMTLVMLVLTFIATLSSIEKLKQIFNSLKYLFN